MQAWKLEDWLEHHGIEGQKWGVRRGPPYPLTPEAKSYKDKPPIDEVLAKSQTRSTIVQDAIRSGEVSKSINREKQMRHTLTGHPEGRSYLYGDVDFAQKLVDELSGTGEAVIVKDDIWTKHERVVAPEVVGCHVDKSTGVQTETKAAMIVYSKTGTHIYPRKETR